MSSLVWVGQDLNGSLSPCLCKASYCQDMIVKWHSHPLAEYTGYIRREELQLNRIKDWGSPYAGKLSTENWAFQPFLVNLVSICLNQVLNIFCVIQALVFASYNTGSPSTPLRVWDLFGFPILMKERSISVRKQGGYVTDPKLWDTERSRRK